MVKVAVIMIALLSCAMFSDCAGARVRYISEAELTQQADLVVTGKVIRLEPPEQEDVIKDKMGIQPDKISRGIICATIQIEKVLKGNADGQNVIVEFVEIDPYMEADVQDAQFGMGSKGTACLKKLPNNHYKALGGWMHGWVR